MPWSLSLLLVFLLVFPSCFLFLTLLHTNASVAGLSSHIIYIYLGWESRGSIIAGSGAPASVLFLFYVNVSGPAFPPSLWRYWLLWFSSTSDCLSSWFHPGWLPLVSLWGIGRLSIIHNFLFTHTFLYFPVFPLFLTPHWYSTFKSSLLGLIIIYYYY